MLKIKIRTLKEASVFIKDICSSINIIRTMPFEYIANALNMTENISYSSYDVALSDLGQAADITVIWMDWRLYQQNMEPMEVVEWVAHRLKNLPSTEYVFINNWPTHWEESEYIMAQSLSSRGWYQEFNYLLSAYIQKQDKLYLIDLDYLAAREGLSSYDVRNDEVSHYPLSNKFTAEVARHLGFSLLPSIVKAKLKLIIVDLDYTMYRGVLGEDGLKGLNFTAEHMLLQKVLKHLKNNGVLLAISSKNNESDVFDLIDNHPNFILTRDDFVFIEANWQEKAENITNILRKVNIDASAAIFIDDNPVELAKVQQFIPSLHQIQANETGEETVYRLMYYPGIYQATIDRDGVMRQQDIIANVERDKIMQQNSKDYLNTLGMKLTLYKNNEKHYPRVAELSNKTNQFNTNLNRYTLEKIKSLIERGDSVYTFSLADRLSDSGIIGAIQVRLENNVAILDEVLFSCRALGREVENFSLYLIAQHLPDSYVINIPYTQGDRNAPAKAWLTTLGLPKTVAEIKQEFLKKLGNYEVEIIDDTRTN